MSRPLPFFLLKWLVALGVLSSLLALAYAVKLCVHRQPLAEVGGEAVHLPKRGEQSMIMLDAAQAEAQGLQDEPTQTVQWDQRVAVYGRVAPNPQATVEVRSPFAGTLRAAPATPWPTPGQWIRAGQTLGRLEIRIGPQERLDLQAKLNEARLKQEGMEETLKVQEARVNRLRKATIAEVVPQRELDEALVALAEARTQAATARAAVELWRKALDTVERRKEHSDSAWSEPLTAPADGEVTELAGQPGMVVEAGGLVARLVDFRRSLVRLDIPPEALTPGPPPQVELSATLPLSSLFGRPDQPEWASSAPTLNATLLGPAPQVDVASQLTGYWYEGDVAHAPELAPRTEADPGRAGQGSPVWRPGRFVKAHLKVPAGKTQPAVAVPRTALLYHQGRTLVFVRVAPGRFERREVQVLGGEGERWVLSAGVAAGEPVVSRQAQVLLSVLSEEFRGDVDDD